MADLHKQAEGRRRNLEENIVQSISQQVPGSHAMVETVTQRSVSLHECCDQSAFGERITWLTK